MKNLFRLMLVGAIVMWSSSTFAQAKLKFGHINSQDIIKLMPERTAAKDSLEKLSKKLGEELEIMQVELNNAYEKYLKEKATLTQTAIAMREDELQNMQQRVQTFQMVAQEDLQAAEGNLLKPIYDKFQKALEDVGNENGFIYIFDTNAVLFHSAQSEDVSTMVKTKLGIK